jgi:hypothetical protein
VEGRVGATVSGRRGRAVAPTLEPAQMLPHGRYRLRYRPLLGPVAVARCHLLIDLFKFKF